MDRFVDQNIFFERIGALQDYFRKSKSLEEAFSA
jgi:hypothetical protein